uniref:Uncharacterized protein n=1 Tax=Anopheles maculatus TaxID=74869 RepID=A0A182SAC8_9DIPT
MGKEVVVVVVAVPAPFPLATIAVVADGLISILDEQDDMVVEVEHDEEEEEIDDEEAIGAGWMVPLLLGACWRKAPAVVVDEEDDDGVSAKATVAVEEGEDEAVEQVDDGAEGMAVKIVLAWAGFMVAEARFANEIFERSVSVNC